MRENVANYLDNNSVFYHDFLAQPVESNNAYNADTDAPGDEDAFIDTVSDPEQQVQLRWERYIQRFRNGAWGNHVAIQGISNEFNIAINIISSEHSNMVHIVTRNGDVEHEVYIGLILQYHYVGLHKITESDNVANGSETETTDTTSSTNNPLNDE